MPATLEHANVTVTNAERTAAWMCDLFGWSVRWKGPALDGGTSLHVGTQSQYLALYQPARPVQPKDGSYATKGGLNHIGLVVDDLDASEKAVKAAGFVPTSHADYSPGRRFYFEDRDGIEFEVVAYG
jgi:catechol 2,3-dioxygenase-like lactoylglutathione lyase family enzyme